MDGLAGRSELVLTKVQWFRGGLVFKEHRLADHSTLGLRVIQKKKVLTNGRFGRTQ